MAPLCRIHVWKKNSGRIILFQIETKFSNFKTRFEISNKFKWISRDGSLGHYLSSFRNSFSSLCTVWRWHWKFYKQSTIDTVEVFRLPDFEYWLVRGSSVSLGSGIKVNYPQLSLESDRYTMMDRLFRSLFCFPWSWL